MPTIKGRLGINSMSFIPTRLHCGNLSEAVICGNERIIQADFAAAPLDVVMDAPATDFSGLCRFKYNMHKCVMNSSVYQ